MNKKNIEIALIVAASLAALYIISKITANVQGTVDDIGNGFDTVEQGVSTYSGVGSAILGGGLLSLLLL